MLYELEIERNKRKSVILIIIMILFMTVLGYLIGRVAFHKGSYGLYAAIFALIFTGIWSLISFYKGDIIVLLMSKAKKINHNDNPRLFNIVEEMSISSGLPMPKVFIMEDPAPNAFATGRDPNHSAICVTTGLLDNLNRDELQGVIGHEMSHIRNFDIRLSLLLAVFVGAIALISDYFLRYMFFFGGGRRRRNSSSKGGGQAELIILVITIALAVLAPIIGKLIQLSISRKREYLADAGSVELTRNPDGLASALEKIASISSTTKLKASNRATQHLYIINPLNPFQKHVTNLFSTHPPINERIQKLKAMSHRN